MSNSGVNGEQAPSNGDQELQESIGSSSPRPLYRKPSMQDYWYYVVKPDVEIPGKKNENDNDEEAKNGNSSAKNESVSVKLRNVLGKSIPVDEDSRLDWRITKNRDNGLDILEAAKNYKTLVGAEQVLKECFEQDHTVDRDILHDLIMNWESPSGSPNYNHFYTVVLKQDNETLTAALVQISPPYDSVNIPFAATKEGHRKQGNCPLLLKYLEELMVLLGIKRIVLPSVNSALKFWKRCGFSQAQTTTFTAFEHYTVMEKQLGPIEKRYASQTEQVYEALKESLNVPVSLKESKLDWRLLKFKDNGFNVLEMAENYSHLVAAERVLKRWFNSSITIPATGRDLIHDVVFNWESASGSENYSNYYTIILEKSTTIVCAAAVTVCAQDKQAEVSLIGADKEYTEQGVFEELVKNFEELLLVLGIQSLVVLSTQKGVDFWRSMGFSEMSLERGYTSLIKFRNCLIMEKPLKKTV